MSKVFSLGNMSGNDIWEVEYSSLRMADYLAPNSSGLTILEKQEMFAVINRMINISYNFPQNKKIDICRCGQEETMVHIYYCKQLNIKEEILSYEKIFNGNIGELMAIFRRFKYKLRLSWAKLSPSWDWAVIKIYHIKLINKI